MIIIREAGNKLKAFTPGMVVDGAATVFTAYIRNDGWTAIAVIGRVSTEGVYTEVMRISADNGAKCDGVFIAQSGSNLLVLLTAHEGDTAYDVQFEVVQNICVPYPGNMPQLAMAGAYIPPEGGGGEPIDYERIHTMITDAVADIRGQFGGNIRAGIQNKAEDGLVHLIMPPPDPPDPDDPKPAIYQAALFQFVKNASANPWANVLNGQDTWGIQQRNALKAVIREVLQEGTA